MPMKSINPVTVLERYRKQYPTQQEAAEALGISTAYMSDLLNGRRDCPDWLLGNLGLERIIIEKPRQTRKKRTA